MKKGQHSAYPCPRIDTPRGMTYRQNLVSRLAPVIASELFSTDIWADYDDAANSLMCFVDAIIEAEKETAR